MNGVARLLQTISAKAGKAGLPFFVIGGYAVMGTDSSARPMTSTCLPKRVAARLGSACSKTWA
jgi:hypothetical protein